MRRSATQKHRTAILEALRRLGGATAGQLTAELDGYPSARSHRDVLEELRREEHVAKRTEPISTHATRTTYYPI